LHSLKYLTFQTQIRSFRLAHAERKTMENTLLKIQLR